MDMTIKVVRKYQKGVRNELKVTSSEPFLAKTDIFISGDATKNALVHMYSNVRFWILDIL